MLGFDPVPNASQPYCLTQCAMGIIGISDTCQ